MSPVLAAAVVAAIIWIDLWLVRRVFRDRLTLPQSFVLMALVTGGATAGAALMWATR